MHDCSVATGDAWLAAQVPRILGSPAFTQQRSVLVVTWDEDDGSASNTVATILIGSGVRPGSRTDAAYNHYSLLRTIEAALGVEPLTGNDAAAAPIGGIWS